MLLRALSWLLLGVVSTVHAEEPRYWIGDRLWLGVYADSSLSSPNIATVPSGTAVEVQEERSDRVKIQAETGEIGWIRKRYLVAEPPYAVQLNDAEIELEQQIKSNQDMSVRLSELNDVESTIKTLQEELETVTAQQQVLHQENRELLEKSQKSPFSWPQNGQQLMLWASVFWPLLLAPIPLMLLAYLIGSARVKGRIRRRFHGMHIE